jgi:hypothetical protein
MTNNTATAALLVCARCGATDDSTLCTWPSGIHAFRPPFYATTERYWFKGRDSYGRTTHSLKATHRGQHGTVAVVVVMPKAWVESHGDDRYLVSDWRAEQVGQRPEPVYFRTLAKAKAHAESLVRPLAAGELDALDAYYRVVAAEADANKLTEWAQHHRTGASAALRRHADSDLAVVRDAARDQADMHEVMRRIVVQEINRRTR